MTAIIRDLGLRSLTHLANFGKTAVFLCRVIAKTSWYRGIGIDVVKQTYQLGFQSLGVIAVSAIFIGLVLSLQGIHTLAKFGALSQLGPMIALSILREMGPVISALLFSGRACSALTAEIGLLKASDQLDSMTMMGIDPMLRIIVPRFWSGVFALPMLNFIFCALAIWAGYYYSTQQMMLDDGMFWTMMQNAVSWENDIKNGMIKSVVFAVVLVWIAVYQGMQSSPTANGISQATTKTVVLGALSVLACDFILTALMIGDW